MKNDHFFKLVAAIILVGVVVALAGPSHASSSTEPAREDLAAPAHATE